ncbi:MAG: Hsp20/alpha crystallin family protein [Anaerolineae bacterium]|jgi:HSP20 family protein
MSSLIRWEPFRDLMTLQRAMDRLIDGNLSALTATESMGAGLALDMYETDHDLVVKTALPGVKPDDVEISVLGDTLTIQGEFKHEQDDEKRDYILRERRYGRFFRSVSLPRDVEADKARAEFEDGVLTLSIPKPESARPKTIKVRAKKS